MNRFFFIKRRFFYKNIFFHGFDEIFSDLVDYVTAYEKNWRTENLGYRLLFLVGKRRKKKKLNLSL